MVFNMEARIPWRDGAVLIFKRPTREQEATLKAQVLKKIDGMEKNKIDNEILRQIGALSIEAQLVGWEDINDSNGNPLEFNENTRHAVYSCAIKDDTVSEPILTFVRGPLPNSKAGSTASLNTNGHQTNATDASETKTGKADVK